MAEDGGLRGTEAEANWLSRPQATLQLQLGPGLAARPRARRILGKAAGAPGGRSFGDAERPVRYAAWFPAAMEARGEPRGCGELSEGETKAAGGTRLGGGRTGAGAARRRGLRQGYLFVHNLARVKADQPTP